jgi:transcriptional regulator with PAS, ATPase and Fis domain
MSLPLQSRLLRALEERTFRRVGGEGEVAFDAHVIAASNRDLRAEVDAGRFREDLFYRLTGYTIKLPPLRERGNDIFMIADHFIEEFNKKMNRRVKGLSQEVIELFRRYLWPGNVRELYRVIEHAMTEGDTDLITIDQFPYWAFRTEKAADRNNCPNPLREGETFRQYQYRNGLEVIQLVLEEYGGNHTKAARRLGLGKAGLTNWKRRAREYLDKRKAG